MNASGNRLRDVRMFVTDADGTLFGQRPEFDQFRDFKERVTRIRASYGTVWAVCTGRSLRSFIRIFRPMQVFGIEPDYVIARHAYTYERRDWGYLPHWIWNARVLWLQWKDRIAIRRAIPRLARAVIRTNPFARVIHRGPDRLCLRFEDEGAAKYGIEILRAEARPLKHLQIFEGSDEVEVRTIPFTKGLAVKELARHLGIPEARILVIGDGHNDISMIEMTPPCLTACPANAAPEVVEAVHRTGGHIAEERSLAGVMEALDAYERGQVNDRMPPHRVGEASAPSFPRHHGRSGGRIAGVGLLLAVIYTTLLVLAHYGLLPYGHVISRPYHALVDGIDRLIHAGRHR